MDRSNELGNENVWKLLIKFSIPAVIGMLVNALYSVVDRIFVGRGVGSIALSGVAVTFPITNIIMAVGMLVGIGSAAVVSIKLGQKKPEEAEHILGNALVLSVLITLITSILGLAFLEPLLVMFGASAETMPYARQFAAILLAGAVLQNIGFGLNPIIRSQGDPKTAMKTMLIGAVINVALNPLFIFGFKLGVAGSALATLISQAVCTIWIFAYFTRGKSLLKLKKANLKLQKHIVSQILAIGVSPFAMQMAASMVTICINTNLAKYGGDLAIGAYSLIMSIAILILMPAFGVNQGAQPIIGFNFGSGQLDRVKKALNYSMLVNTVIASAGFLAVQLFPVQIISMFNSTDAQLIAIGSDGITKYLMMFALVGPSSAIINYFQSVGKAKHSMGLSLSRQVIILIPLVLIMPHFFQLDGIWMAGAVSDLISSLLCFAFIAKEAKLLNGTDENILENRAAACNVQC